ncbi:hypothetical protein H2514_05065 [Lysobacter sp. CW239]|uniref:hypothetical protein n=1 Tax=Lysobacteraceae TaxID=32033 RepID=UPI0012EC891F|nr:MULTISPECIES: hypothetical protein [Lysobacter]QOD92000.1 hypothetical protein H2514_05065 [Lysobacter sp. CW239]
MFKLVYLLDCLHAEAHEGETVSGSDWYFHSFGPFAVNLAGGIDELASRGLVQSLSDEYRGKDFSLYWLGEYPQGPSLSEVGVVGTGAARFGSMVRKFAKDLSKLLDHAYFKTLPMQGATPGKRIDFGVLKDAGQVQAHKHTSISDHAKILKLAQLAERVAQTYTRGKGNARAMAAHRPIYDLAFVEASAAMDAEDADRDPIAFTAQLA